MTYKYLLFGILLSIFGGAGYYLHSSPGAEFLADAMSQQDKSNYGVSSLEVFAGTYTCTKESGCDSNISFTLHDDTTLEVSKITEGAQIPLGEGTWGVGRNGSVVFVIHPTIQATSTQISKITLIAKKISTMKISNFSNKTNLPGMADPTLVRTSN